MTIDCNGKGRSGFSDANRVQVTNKLHNGRAIARRAASLQTVDVQATLQQARGHSCSPHNAFHSFN